MSAPAVPAAYGGRRAPQPTAAGPSLAETRAADEGARRLLSGALAVFILIAVARIHAVLGGIGEKIPFAKIAVVLLAAAAWQAFGRDDVRRLLRLPTARAFAAIVVLAAVSAPFGVWRGNSVGFFIGPFLPVIALFVLGSLGLGGDRRTLRTSATALAVGVGIDALVVLSGRTTFQGRAMLGGGLDPNDTAALLVASIPIALTLASERGVLRRLFFLAIALVSVGALVKTGSRGGMLGLVAMALSLVIIARGRQRLGYIVTIVIGAAVFAASAQDQLRERFATTFESDYNQTDEDGRIQIWKRGIGYMVSNPLLGVGPNNFGVAEGMISDKANDRTRRRGVKFAAAHNSFVQIGAELGVGGLVAFVAMIGTALAGCWRVARSTGQSDPHLVLWGRAGFVSLFGISVSAFFLSLAYTPMVLVIVTLCTAVILSAARARERAAAGGWALEVAGPAAAGAPVAGAGWRSRRSLARAAAVPTRAPAAPRAARAWRSARRRA
jgi:O-antigen ligase